jgi:hypothetical protein
VGDAVTFDGTASYDPDGTIVRYKWYFGDGETAEGPVVQHTYNLPESYEAWLVTDNAARPTPPGAGDRRSFEPAAGHHPHGQTANHEPPCILGACQRHRS